MIEGRLPENIDDFIVLVASQKVKHTKCILCGNGFDGRTHTSLGWRETQISGFCEECFDETFAEESNA